MSVVRPRAHSHAAELPHFYVHRLGHCSYIGLASFLVSLQVSYGKQISIMECPVFCPSVSFQVIFPPPEPSLNLYIYFQHS